MISIRCATPHDLTAVARLHAESWRRSYVGMLSETFLRNHVVSNRLALWQKRFAEPPSRMPYVLVAVDGNDVVGFGCLLKEINPGLGPLLDNLHVEESFKGRGIGSRLLSEIAIEAGRSGNRMHLWVLEENLDARRFYELRGGQPGDSRVEELVPGSTVREVRYVWEGEAFRALTNRY